MINKFIINIMKNASILTIKKYIKNVKLLFQK